MHTSRGNVGRKRNDAAILKRNDAITKKNDAITVDGKQYNESEIRKLLKEVAELRSEKEEYQKLLKDSRQENDKIKSVLNYRNSKEQENQQLSKPRIVSAQRAKKQVVYAERVTSMKVEMIKYKKSAESLEMITRAFSRNDFMRHLWPHQIKQIAECMYEKKVKSGFNIIEENEEGDHMYVLASGELEVLKSNKKIRNMYPGELFGELAVLQNCHRTATVKATVETNYWTIDRKVYQAILQKSNTLQTEEHQQFLRSVNFLKNLPQDKLNKIADALSEETYEKGQCIVTEGDDGNSFYIIKKGTVQVLKNMPGTDKKQEIRTLGIGDYFGEQALLKNEIRSASVLAITETVDVLTLDQDDFTRLIGNLDEIKTKTYNDEVCLTERPSSKEKKVTSKSISKEIANIDLNDFEVLCTLGAGAFGRVSLVRVKSNAKSVFALKVLKKKFIVDSRQQEQVISERNLLMEVDSQFICKLYRTFRDKKYVYMLLEVCLGGEVWNLLRKLGSFNDKITKFVLSCVICALEYLHRKFIIYRDLKPENLLITSNGYIKLCDFGFAKKIECGKKTFTFCGTPEYVSPEIIMNKGHDIAVDLWALGILVIELLTGCPPFQNTDTIKIYQTTLAGITKYPFPSKVSKIAKNLIEGLCKLNPTERLGYGQKGVMDIKSHRYFIDVNWTSAENMSLISPIVPKIENETDIQNFDIVTSDTDVPPDETSGWDIEFDL